MGEMTTTDPYDPVDMRENQPDTSLGGSRFQVASAIGLAGGVIAAFTSGIGHFIVFMILEGSFAPPLRPQENMGQFGFLTVYVGFFGGLVGLSLGLIPYTRFIGWVPVFLVVILIAAAAEPIDFASTAGFAMIVIALVLLLVGLLTDIGCRFMLR